MQKGNNVKKKRVNVKDAQGNKCITVKTGATVETIRSNITM